MSDTTTPPTPARGGKIRLMCVRRGRKLRIRFHSYTDGEGRTYTNVYNNSYNCQFPRDIRQEGRLYEIGSEDLVLVAPPGKVPFYRVDKASVRIVHEHDAGEVAAAVAGAAARPVQVFEVNECVVCLEAAPSQIFVPCAHLCACASCWQELKKRAKANCPLCRRHIVSTMVHVPTCDSS